MKGLCSLSFLRCKSRGIFRNMQYLREKNSEKMKIVGLGNALVDVLLRLESDETLSTIGIRKGVMEMIDERQMIALRTAQKDLERAEAPGGSVCNTMRAIALLGGESGFVGKIGDDAVGAYYESALKKAGVAPYFIRTTGISGSCTVLISPDGERTMCTFLGPAPTISPDEIRESVLSDYHIIYIEGYLLVNEPLVRSAMEKAKRLGLKVALDLSNFNIVESFKPLLEDLIPRYVDILFSNESEAETFTGQPAREAVRTLAKQVSIALVTLGKEGSLIASGDVCHAVPALGEGRVDTTGAGDNFAAGFLYGISRGASIDKAGLVGSLLAGEVVRVVGPQIPESAWEQIKLKVQGMLA